MPDTAALTAHILSQTRQNVEFLMSQNEISRDAGQSILAQLPNASDIALRDLSDQTRRMTIPSPGPLVQSGPAVVSPPMRREVPQPPPRGGIQRAKALWSYNENNSEPNDLSFRGGDIIEIVTETNADWWTGRINGRQGLFPSNYVEKLDSPASAPPPSYPAPQNETYRGGPNSFSPPPASYGPPANVDYRSPPPGNYQSGPPQPYNPYMGPPMQPMQAAPQQQMVVQQQEPPKQSRMGGLGGVVSVFPTLSIRIFTRNRNSSWPLLLSVVLVLVQVPPLEVAS
ncbi:SH3-domain-containing protein [Auriscalpium vulgare]|uniref:SH3-domain-containing protein n=1 Tax=Auriscalpium vulgare TaxID=40419 RepID=A0ACB8RZB5_9AGAM|nr:SH3-domain-containing protein [Auriscalpium vulgare]